MISIGSKGDFKNLEKLLKKSLGRNYLDVLEKYAKEGVAALASATPKDTGETAGSWGYEIVEENGKVSIHWNNSHIEKGVNIAVILQYGHGTRNGGYVQGRDYINPALRPVFDQLANAAWKEVTSI
jgi:hypothetical protein